jgi:hypothetical protein
VNASVQCIGYPELVDGIKFTTLHTMYRKIQLALPRCGVQQQQQQQQTFFLAKQSQAPISRL